MGYGSFTRVKVTDAPTVISSPSGKFNDIGAVSGGIIQGVRAATLSVVVSAIGGGTLTVFLDSSSDGVNFTTGGANGVSAPITANGLYQLGYSTSSPGSILRVTYTLTAGTATVDVVLEADSLS